MSEYRVPVICKGCASPLGYDNNYCEKCGEHLQAVIDLIKERNTALTAQVQELKGRLEEAEKAEFVISAIEKIREFQDISIYCHKKCGLDNGFSVKTAGMINESWSNDLTTAIKDALAAYDQGKEKEDA